MFRVIVWAQWKATRALVLLTTVLAFALPLAALQAASDLARASEFVTVMEQWGAAYALLAAALGLLVALGAWRRDHLGGHAYALSLPLARSRYVLLRFGAGALFLVPTVIGLLLGGLLVAASDAIPAGLHVYAAALALRFAFAALVAYAIFFAIASSTSKTAGYIIAAMGGLVFAQYLIGVVSDGGQDVISPVLNFIFYKPGILSVFAGRWMLVDV